MSGSARLARPLWVVLVAAGASAARADSGGADAARYAVEARLDNREQRDPKDPAKQRKDGVLSVEGRARDLPDGTLLHVTLAVKSSAERSIEASFFMVSVEKERFSARKVFEAREFARLDYYVKVELILSAQRAAVRDYIRRNIGLPQEARLLLAQQELSIGTPVERAEFERQTLVDLARFAEQFQQNCASVLAVVSTAAAEQKDYEKEVGGATQRVRAAATTFGGYLDRFVAWKEKELIDRLKNANSELSWSLRSHQKGETDKARRAALRVEQQLKDMRNELRRRLPEREKDPKEPAREPQGE